MEKHYGKVVISRNKKGQNYVRVEKLDTDHVYLSRSPRQAVSNFDIAVQRNDKWYFVQWINPHIESCLGGGKFDTLQELIQCAIDNGDTVYEFEEYASAAHLANNG
jgi:c-di-AMP phosphodiesterase-like protein